MTPSPLRPKRLQNQQKKRQKRLRRQTPAQKRPRHLLPKRPPNPKPPLVRWWPCAVTTDLAKNVPRLRLQGVAAMANRVASLAIVRHATVGVMGGVKVLRRVAPVWAMPPSVRNVMP